MSFFDWFPGIGKVLHLKTATETQTVSGKNVTVTIPVVRVDSAARAASLVSATAAGSVAAGATSAEFENAGGANATVAGAALPAGKKVRFVAPEADTLGAIAYDGTGTTLLIAAVR